MNFTQEVPLKISHGPHWILQNNFFFGVSFLRSHLVLCIFYLFLYIKFLFETILFIQYCMIVFFY